MTVAPSTNPPGSRPPNPLRDPRGRRDWAKRYASSAVSALRNPDFSDLERFCFFIGYSRSGHTLVATMLNAHPEAVISHELDAVNCVRHRFRRSQLFSLLLERDQRFGSMGRTWSGYQYEVSGQSQGSFERLRVIGDKRARSSALQIAGRPELLDQVRKVVRVPISVIHVTRNPFDNIATEARRHKLSLTEATAWYAQICEAVSAVRPLLAPSELIDIRYEEFAADPLASLAELCRFIDVEPGEAYLEACAALVWPIAKRTRGSIEWSAGERRGVERLIEQYSVFAGYTFDD